jgi:hypothetical protein
MGFAAFTRSPPSRIERLTSRDSGDEPLFLVVDRTEDRWFRLSE